MRRARLLVVGAAAVLGAAAVALLLPRLTTAHHGPAAPIPKGSVTAQASSSPPAPAPTPTPSHAGSLVATAAVPSVVAHRQPAGAVASSWANPVRKGVPLTFRVVGERGAWLQVQLPQRPNGSTGWIRTSDVRLTSVTYRLAVSTERNTLSLFHDDALLKTYAVATGTGGTPTPHGSFYLTELLAPTNAGYGPFAFGLSAYSEALSSFGGGPGQIGLHGTADAASIGHAASHGCIRMSNRDITALARLLPLGTPITIR